MKNRFTIKEYNTAFSAHWDESFVFNGERHINWEIVYVKEGSVIITEDDRVYQLHERQMVIHAPWEFHRIRSATGSSPTVYVMSFIAEGNLPDRLLNGVFTLTQTKTDEYLSIFKLVSANINQQTEDAWEWEESRYRLGAFLLQMRTERADVRRSDTQSARTYHTVASYMAAHVKENLSVKAIAQANYISTGYLKHLFLQYAGVTTKQYYTQLQISEANKLLDDNFTIAQIAEQLGFSSPTYFSTFYKQNTGTTPKGRKTFIKIKR